MHTTGDTEQTSSSTTTQPTGTSTLATPAQGAFHTAAEVIFLVGDSVRRIHALEAMTSLLEQHNITFSAFSTSLNHAHLTTLAARGHVAIRQYSYGAFQTDYKTYEAPSEQKSVIIVEMDMRTLLSMKLAKHSVQTIIFSDVVCFSPDFAVELRDTLVDQVRTTPTFQTILYNNDLGFLPRGAALLSIDDIPVRSHFSFGKSQVSALHWSQDGDTLRGSMPNSQVSLPAFDLNTSSQLRKEGIFAALSWFQVSSSLVPANITTGFGVMPLWEEHHGPLTLYWAGPFVQKSDVEMLLSLKQSKYLCLGMAPYLRFEDVIENRIEEFETILVVAEDEGQVSLFQEYFLQKERDSYHVIIYLPELEKLTAVFRNVFARAEQVTMLFDQPASFPPL